MADPRGRGFNRSHSKWYVPPRRWESPVDHGWTLDRVSDVDGAAIFKLGDTEMKPYMNGLGGSWLVLPAEGDGVVYEGYTLAEITEIVTNGNESHKRTDT